jgi:TIR domain
MDRHYFVSYSRIDGAEFAGHLADRLVAGLPSYAVWLDVRDMQLGMDWDEQITEAIQTCQGVLFLMTSDSVQAHSICKSEWVWAASRTASGSSCPGEVRERSTGGRTGVFPGPARGV